MSSMTAPDRPAEVDLLLRRRAKSKRVLGFEPKVKFAELVKIMVDAEIAKATGVAKQLRYKAESTWGTAPGASGAQLLRRVTSTLDLKKQTYRSNEIRSDYQVNDMRHGVRSVEGTINGELSPGTYKDFLAAAVRKAFVATVRDHRRCRSRSPALGRPTR
jgi:hypothetical protein